MSGRRNNQQILGAVKVKDGLYIGDQLAAQDIEFMMANKVTHVINCTGLTLGNLFEPLGILYLTFPWNDLDQERIFDESDEILTEIVKFIDEAADAGESTLVHSFREQNRSCCVLTAYFMKKYNWRLLKTLEYLNSRRADLEIPGCLFQELNDLEKKLMVTERLKDSWEVQHSLSNNEDLLIRNTYLNSKNAPIAEIFTNGEVIQRLSNVQKLDKLTWRDKENKMDLHVAHYYQNLAEVNINPLRQQQQGRYSNNKSAKPLRSCVKGSRLKQQRYKHTRGNSEGHQDKSICNTNFGQTKVGLQRSLSGKFLGIVEDNNFNSKNNGIDNSNALLVETNQNVNQYLKNISNINQIMKVHNNNNTKQFTPVTSQIHSKEKTLESNYLKVMPNQQQQPQQLSYSMHPLIAMENPTRNNYSSLPPAPHINTLNIDKNIKKMQSQEKIGFNRNSEQQNNPLCIPSSTQQMSTNLIRSSSVRGMDDKENNSNIINTQKANNMITIKTNMKSANTYQKDSAKRINEQEQKRYNSLPKKIDEDTAVIQISKRNNNNPNKFKEQQQHSPANNINHSNLKIIYTSPSNNVNSYQSNNNNNTVITGIFNDPNLLRTSNNNSYHQYQFQNSTQFSRYPSDNQDTDANMNNTDYLSSKESLQLNRNQILSNEKCSEINDNIQQVSPNFLNYNPGIAKFIRAPEVTPTIKAKDPKSFNYTIRTYQDDNSDDSNNKTTLNDSVNSQEQQQQQYNQQKHSSNNSQNNNSLINNTSNYNTASSFIKPQPSVPSKNTSTTRTKPPMKPPSSQERNNFKENIPPQYLPRQQPMHNNFLEDSSCFSKGVQYTSNSPYSCRSFSPETGSLFMKQDKSKVIQLPSKPNRLRSNSPSNSSYGLVTQSSTTTAKSQNVNNSFHVSTQQQQQQRHHSDHVSEIIQQQNQQQQSIGDLTNNNNSYVSNNGENIFNFSQLSSVGISKPRWKF